MKHCGTRVLTTGRLLLRPLGIGDAEMMFGNWANDPEVTRYLRWEPHRTWLETAEILNEWSKHYIESDFYLWGICDRRTEVLIGAISLIRGEPDAAWAPLEEQYGEVWEPGYSLGRKWWNEGYATEALCAVRDFWLNKVGGQWLACCHANDNVASGAVMQKAGFVYHHDAVYHKFNGQSVPCRAYALLPAAKPTDLV
ncbi:MAG: GNAT family N-acetyltransferase [Gemmiger sp.]